MLVYLSPVTEQDTPDLIAASHELSQADGAEFAVLPSSVDEARLQLEIDNSLRQRQAGERFLAREGGTDGEIIGGVEVTDSPTGPEVGGWIMPAARRQRVSAATVGAFLQFVGDAFPDASTINAYINRDNRASSQFAKRLGFTLLNAAVEEGVDELTRPIKDTVRQVPGVRVHIAPNALTQGGEYGDLLL